MTYHVDTTITCNVIGGLPPHKVDLTLPNHVTKTWTEDGTGNSLTCTGTHDKTCTYTLKPEYNSDGNYKCVGYNKVRESEEKQQESTVVQLTTVRSTEVTISHETLSVLTNGTVDINCTVVGKPLVEISAVSWSHETLPDLDLSGNVSTVKGSQDDYTLVSTLSIVNPLTEYSGSFNCNVQAENDQVITKSVVVSINNREFLDSPTVTHNGGKYIEQGVEMTVTCHVKGFPRPSATLIYKNFVDCKQIRTISGAYSIANISPTTTEFEFQLSTSCDYSQYKFICETNSTKYTDSRVLKESNSVQGPIVIGCENAAESNTGVMIASGIAAVLFVIIILGGIYILHLRRRQSPYSATGNVVYVNTNPENLVEVEQTSEHKYDDVVLHVSTGEAAYVNTAVQSTPALHLYNDVVLPTQTTDDTPYAYARSEDVVRHNIRPPVYNNHELR